MNCPCQSGLSFSLCCQPYIQGQPAPTAEALMRSRYSAFATAAVDYLLSSSAPELHSADERRQLFEHCSKTQWLALHILNTERGSAGDREGFVEFAAFYTGNDGPGQLHERSRFEHRDGRWLYVSGEFLPPLSFGRNEPCWCRSGKKFKKCHG